MPETTRETARDYITKRNKAVYALRKDYKGARNYGAYYVDGYKATCNRFDVQSAYDYIGECNFGPYERNLSGRKLG